MSVTKTTISWCDSTWSPLRGCSLVSHGCTHCYAMRQAGRFSGPGQPYEGLVRKTSQGWQWTGEVRLIEKDVEVPLHWRKPRRIFVNPMSDLFHEHVPDTWIDTIHAVMFCAEALDLAHQFQILTKRPERMYAYYAGYPWPRVSAIAKARWNWHWGAGNRWYPGNVWLGVSCENQATADERIPWLLKTPAAIRWISAEPLLGPLNLHRWGHKPIWGIDGRHSNVFCKVCSMNHGPHPQLDWIVAGGESGPKSRPCDEAWIRSLVQQCQDAGTACFVKQMGSVWAKAHGAHDAKGAGLEDFPADLQVQELPGTVREMPEKAPDRGAEQLSLLPKV